MPANTPNRGLPYPLPTEPVAEGAQAIRNLAEQVDLKIVPFGTPLPWIAATIPAGYIEFDGRALTAGTYPKLFALYGATLPDLRNRFLFGASATHPIGEVAGAETHTLTEAQLPSHRHSAQAYNTTAAGGGGTPTILTQQGYTTADWTSIGLTGSGQAHNNMPPFRAVRWITNAG